MFLRHIPEASLLSDHTVFCASRNSINSAPLKVLSASIGDGDEGSKRQQGESERKDADAMRVAQANEDWHLMRAALCDGVVGAVWSDCCTETIKLANTRLGYTYTYVSRLHPVSITHWRVICLFNSRVSRRQPDHTTPLVASVASSEAGEIREQPSRLSLDAYRRWVKSDLSNSSHPSPHTHTHIHGTPIGS